LILKNPYVTIRVLKLEEYSKRNIVYQQGNVKNVMPFGERNENKR